ncbi:hypothetical protein L1787_07770 [Acuticoccus sp. M5D2P5]|uniref:hypothetical protein n=1 Tax=Acuticoccus kalidii TaxID=2910977 RepID=UPI001F2ABBFA|nr:hypothetical protein [Acuticoccus kalidii]MCF3933308.1 hypothetical protein [Acuticoccus kalidii]
MAYTYSGREAANSRDTTILGTHLEEVGFQAAIAALGIRLGRPTVASLPASGNSNDDLAAVFNDGGASGVYRWTGSGWNRLGPLPGIPGPQGAPGEYDFATLAEAQAGTATDKVMSPLRVSNAIVAVRASTAETTAGVLGDKFATPAGVKSHVDARRADEATATAGSDHTTLMTPVRVNQYINGRRSDLPMAETGTDHTTIMTPLRVFQAITARLADEATAVAGTDNLLLITAVRLQQYINNRRASLVQAAGGTDPFVLMTPSLVAHYVEQRLATLTEARDRSNLVKLMTPGRVAQQIDDRRADQATAEGGANSLALLTPLGARWFVEKFVTDRWASIAVAAAGASETQFINPRGVKAYVDGRMATLAEAQDGSSSVKIMSPNMTFQFLITQRAGAADMDALVGNKLVTPQSMKYGIDIRRADLDEARAGTDHTKIMTPLRVKQHVDQRLANDPINTATQAALNEKASLTALNAVTASLAGKAPAAHTHDVGAIDGLEAILATRGAGLGTRPGEAPTDWLSSVDGADTALAHYDASAVAVGQHGAVLRIKGQGVVAPAVPRAFESWHIYRLRAAFRMYHRGSDPAGDTVTVGVVWLDRNKKPIGTATFEEIRILDVPARYVAGPFHMALDAGEGVEAVAPNGTVYARPFVRSFSADAVLDVEVIETVDTWDLVTWTPSLVGATNAVAALDASVSALAAETTALAEKIDLAPRTARLTVPNNAVVAVALGALTIGRLGITGPTDALSGDLRINTPETGLAKAWGLGGVELATGAHSGTTGDPGSVTVSLDAPERLLVENRSGSTLTFITTLVG